MTLIGFHSYNAKESIGPLIKGSKPFFSCSTPRELYHLLLLYLPLKGKFLPKTTVLIINMADSNISLSSVEGMSWKGGEIYEAL